MDNYFKSFGICTIGTEISLYGKNDVKVHINPGTLIKVSPQSMPQNEQIRLITLLQSDNDLRSQEIKIYLCHENNFEIVDNQLWDYLIVESNVLYRFNVYRRRRDWLSLKLHDVINIYLCSTQSRDELKICCTIEYIGEVPEYGKGIFFGLRATTQNFEFPISPQMYFIGKYCKGFRSTSIIVTASAFFEVTNMDDVIHRPTIEVNRRSIAQPQDVVKPNNIKPKTEKEILQEKFANLKQRLAANPSPGSVLPQAQQSRGAIKKVQPEKNVQPEVRKLKFNSLILTCAMCRIECPIGSGIILDNCGHIFCYDCLIAHIKSKNGQDMVCPFINKKYKCNSNIEFYEIEALNSEDTKNMIKINNKNKNRVNLSVKKDTWTCLKCTYENKRGDRKCSMCDTNRLSAASDENSQCMNCFDLCDETRIFMIPECSHNVCNNCLIAYLDNQQKDVIDKLECPIKFCDYIISPQDVLQMFLKFESFYIKNGLNLFDICVSCQVAHPNVSCKQFQMNFTSSNAVDMKSLRQKYQRMIGDGDAVNCPKCKLIIVNPGGEGASYCYTCNLVVPNDNNNRWQCKTCANINVCNNNICSVCGRGHNKADRKRGKKSPTISCMFCYTDVQFIAGVALNDCSHFFCKICLEALIETEEAIIQCPYERNNKKCDTQIEDYEKREIMGVQKYKQHKIRQVRKIAEQTENAVLCLNEKCPGWCLKDDLHDSKLFICTICHQPNCLECKVVHAGMVCADYNDPEKRAEFALPRAKQYDELVKLEGDRVVQNNKKFTCQICFAEIDAGNGIALRECLHEFCKDCITDTVKHMDAVEAKCPFANDNYKCESIIQEREIKAIVDEKTYNRYIAKWFTVGANNIEHGFHCKTVNCNGFWENDENINEQECPLCKAINCLNCQAIHPDMKCDEYQTSNETKKQLEDEIARGIGMRCPKCKIIIVRVSGCDWIQCAMCKTEICWVTKGARWGPAGHGDTSGGCRCRVNGQRCHPNCMNCH